MYQRTGGGGEADGETGVRRRSSVEGFSSSAALPDEHRRSRRHSGVFRK